MNPTRRHPMNRRFFARLGLALPAPLAWGWLRHGQTTAAAVAQSDTSPTTAPSALAPTPACADDDAEETLAQTEGPFFTPNSPERASLLEPGLAGRRLVVSGRVLSTGCEPVAGALLEFWQADDDGVYDNVGYRLRGHQFADDEGRYELETIVPGLYTGRTRHIHVKAQAPDRPELTTQLYFPDEPANDRDGIFDPALVVTMAEQTATATADDPRQAAFDFVLDLG